VVNYTSYEYLLQSVGHEVHSQTDGSPPVKCNTVCTMKSCCAHTHKHTHIRTHHTHKYTHHTSTSYIHTYIYNRHQFTFCCHPTTVLLHDHCPPENCEIVVTSVSPGTIVEFLNVYRGYSMCPLSNYCTWVTF